jgi:ribosomal protein S18 acetylase RimI-like enzyme
MQLAPESIARLRRGTAADLNDLLALEREAFNTDRLSRRSFRRFLHSRNAVVIVADEKGRMAGYALVLFRPESRAARLYSIAVAADSAGCGIGPLLLAAAEDMARQRGCHVLRLEVHERNAAALKRYRTSGYRLFGRHRDYYGDGGDALRFEKEIMQSSTGRKISSSPVAPVAG